MYSKTLLLTALGVMFCSGCTTEQQTPAPPEASSKETSVQQTPDPSIQGDDVHAVQPTPAAKEDTVDATSVKAQLEARIRVNEQKISQIFLMMLSQLEELGAGLEVNEQGEIVEVDLSNTQITNRGLVHLAGLTSLQELVLNVTQITGPGLVHLEGLTSLQGLELDYTQITDAGVAKLQKALPNCNISREIAAAHP